MHYQVGRVGIALTSLRPPIFVSVPSQNLDFKRHMSWSVLCSVSSVQMRGIVDIGGIVDHHRLYFLFIHYIFYASFLY
jgi:hypothetical protein